MSALPTIPVTQDRAVQDAIAKIIAHSREQVGLVELMVDSVAVNAASTAVAAAAQAAASATQALTQAGTSIARDGSALVTGDIPFAGHRLTGLGDPVSLQDAATKNYADKLALSAEFVVASNFAGASVTAQIDAAIAAAAGRVVIIPPTMATGEPTSFPVHSPVWDMRGANALGAGRKTIWDLADTNGSNVLTVINDMINPPLSHAGILSLARSTGTLTNNTNVDGAQFSAGLTGVITATTNGVICTGSENGANIGSTGGGIGYLWGAHAYATTSVGSTTNVLEIASIRCIAANHAGSGAVTDLWSLIVDDAIGASTRRGAALIKGNTQIQGDLTVNRIGQSSGSSFLSGNNANYYYLDIGRAGTDVRTAVASAANDFIVGTIAGDALIYTLGNNTLWFGANSVSQLKITALGTQAITGFYPPKDDGSLQTACRHFAGAGAPNNLNGANGDMYFRSDGGALTTIYQRRAGTWAGIV